MDKEELKKQIRNLVSVWLTYFLSTYFCYYSWVLLHFLVLFMGPTILFQLIFTFIYSTFSKKISIATMDPTILFQLTFIFIYNTFSKKISIITK